ncbi:MAG: glycosyltransferase [Gemmatimonadota bacterium]|jgi:succinoglycan biosynthesis protein ExoW|nr:glycosyltransferase [Gemmatimonadota bacterium]
MSTAVAVIIPYFQRKPGLLRRALDSVAAQAGIDRITVLVVDDGSPLPPDDDIQASSIRRNAVVVIRQDNAGPGVARNTGLDAVPSDHDFVAFLDSDDQWTPGHLLNAITALGDDLDFYFSNGMLQDSETDVFSLQQRLEMQSCCALERGSNTYQYTGDMIAQIIRANMIDTSTVVFRRKPLGHIRFDTSYRAACEDHLFWLSCAREGCSFALTTEVELHSGRGVSIYKSIGLGSDTLMSSLIDQFRYYQEIEPLCAPSPELRKTGRDRIEEIRTAVVADILHRLARRLPVNGRHIRAYLSRDPALMVLGLPIAMKIAFRRAKARRTETSNLRKAS